MRINLQNRAPSAGDTAGYTHTLHLQQMYTATPPHPFVVFFREVSVMLWATALALAMVGEAGSLPKEDEIWGQKGHLYHQWEWWLSQEPTYKVHFGRDP